MVCSYVWTWPKLQVVSGGYVVAAFWTSDELFLSPLEPIGLKRCECGKCGSSYLAMCFAVLCPEDFPTRA